MKSRSSSSEQLGSQSSIKSTGSSRRFDALSRKIRKDSVIDRLRKEKMNKVFALNRKLSTGCDPHSKYCEVALKRNKSIIEHETHREIISRNLKCTKSKVAHTMFVLYR